MDHKPCHINIVFIDSYSLDTQPEAAHALSQVRPKYFPFVKKGAIAALDRGPRLGGQVEDTQIILHALVIGRKTADSFVMSVASQCVQKVCRALIYRAFQ